MLFAPIIIQIENDDESKSLTHLIQGVRDKKGLHSTRGLNLRGAKYRNKIRFDEIFSLIYNKKMIEVDNYFLKKTENYMPHYCIGNSLRFSITRLVDENFVLKFLYPSLQNYH
jgi:hypothetical protein